MKDAHRIEPREQVTLSLQLIGGGNGVTRDISASGLYFETDSEQQVGNLIDFEIELDTPGGPMKFKAQGQIVRVEQQDGRAGVGVKLLASRLVPVE
ncbi:MULTISPECIES: PilZ domain-containing protein [Pseudomonas]|uniref:PilZ domain-containing protein n=1 Tax=Pseudomonas monachiensis TaxID=3060212 RepID=A0ABW9HGT2_9PSED|nr:MULTISPECIES: PilZ domain-containing protein [unclassified Pseudomonas]KRB03633.1 pilus assembly protein [Pseudomonas sp. Root68]KRB71008.1 pilus assembly protein [Pseudomonas sp. Root71]